MQLVIIGISFPITVFIYGSLSTVVGGWILLISILLRFLSGLLYAFINVITLGQPWDDEAGVNSTDIRLFVFLMYLFLNVAYYCVYGRTTKNQIREEL